MAMINVKVCADVKNGCVFSETFEAMIDESSYLSASSESGRRKLDSWAKNFFPSAEYVRIIYMERI